MPRDQHGNWFGRRPAPADPVCDCAVVGSLVYQHYPLCPVRLGRTQQLCAEHQYLHRGQPALIVQPDGCDVCTRPKLV